MSNWGPHEARQVDMRASQNREVNLELNLNIPPVEESLGLPTPQRLTATNYGNVSLQVQEDDDDIAFISLREYEHALINKKRRHGYRSNRTRRISEATRRDVVREAAEMSSSPVTANENYDRREMKTGSGSRSPPPEELKFTCSICLDPMIVETSTKCGHIFCKQCIVSVLKSQHKCPTCRRKLKVSEIRRVFLPAATYD